MTPASSGPNSSVPPRAPSGARRRRRSNRGLGIWLFVALALLVLVGPALRGDTEYNRPTGYTAIVRALTASHLVVPVVDRSDRAYDINPALAQNFDSSAGPRGVNLLKHYSDTLSFLGADMALANDSNWDDDGVVKDAHRIVGPYDNVSHWTGDLLFASLDGVGQDQRYPAEQRPVLIDQDTHRRFEMGLGTTASRSATIELYCLGHPAADKADHRCDSDPSEAPSNLTAISLQWRKDRGDVSLVDLQLIADRPVLHLSNFGRELAKQIYVNGQPLAINWQGQSQFPESWIRLDPPLGKKGTNQPPSDISLDVALTGPSGTVSRHFLITKRRMTVSRYRGGAERDRTPGLESLARPIEASLSGPGDVETTLIAELQSAASARLHTLGQALLKQRQDGRPASSFRAGAVMMDGLTGEIAALASFPTAEIDLQKDQRDLTNVKHLLDTNSNFVALPIGSAAKPPFATAIASLHPEAIGLRLNDRGDDMRCVLGMPLTSSISTDLGKKAGSGVSNIDFKKFLTTSSNRYAIALMMIGLIPDVNGHLPKAGWRSAHCQDFDEQPQAAGLIDPATGLRPPFGRIDSDGKGIWDKTIHGRNAVVGQVDTAGQYGSKMSQLFCIDANSRIGDNSWHNGLPPGCTTNLWEDSPVLRSVVARAIDGGSDMLSPVPLQLGFHQVRDLHNDYLIDILGGGRSRWSTILLAQSYARIVTDRAVLPRLAPVHTAPVAAAGGGWLDWLRTWFPWWGKADADHRDTRPNRLNILDSVRAAVLAGMYGVVHNEGGTAKVIMETPAQSLESWLGKGALPDGSLYRVYAKTGTPTVNRINIRAAANLRLSDYMSSGCGLGQQDDIHGHHMLVVPDTLPGPGPVTQGRGDAGLEVALALQTRAPNCAGFQKDIPALAAEIRWINRNKPYDIDLESDDVPFRVDPGSAKAPGEQGPMGRVLSLVVTRYRSGARLDANAVGAPDDICTASVITVNFQARGGGEEFNPNQAFTRDMLVNPIVRKWLGRAGNGCQAVVS